MPLISQIKEMKEQGINEEQISQKLQEQGYSPLEISQSLEQARIKQAISGEQAAVNNEMTPSMMEIPQETNTPLAEIEQIQQTQQPGQAEEYQQYSPYPQYQEYQEYSPQQYQQYSPYSSETMTEIAEQISQEKILALQKNIGNIEEIKIRTERRIENIDERLKKIEAIIDKLQAAILSRIGNYGESIEDIKQEMKMMQDSFSKALNPLIDRAREKEGKESKEDARKRKKSDGFENYLRR